MRCSGPGSSSVRLTLNVLGGTMGGQMVDSWMTEGRFVPPNTAAPHPPNYMFGVVGTEARR